MLVYSAALSNTTVSATGSLIAITAASDHALVILSMSVTQQTDYGDAEAEGLELEIQRQSSLGSGGTAATENPHMVGYPAAGAAVIFDATVGTSTAVLLAEAFNIQAGFIYKPIPEERIYVSPSGILALEIVATAPTDAIDVSLTITWGEIGG